MRKDLLKNFVYFKSFNFPLFSINIHNNFLNSKLIDYQTVEPLSEQNSKYINIARIQSMRNRKKKSSSFFFTKIFSGNRNFSEKIENSIHPTNFNYATSHNNTGVNFQNKTWDTKRNLEQILNNNPLNQKISQAIFSTLSSRQKPEESSISPDLFPYFLSILKFPFFTTGYFRKSILKSQFIFNRSMSCSSLFIKLIKPSSIIHSKYTSKLSFKGFLDLLRNHQGEKTMQKNSHYASNEISQAKPLVHITKINTNSYAWEIPLIHSKTILSSFFNNAFQLFIRNSGILSQNQNRLASFVAPVF